MLDFYVLVKMVAHLDNVTYSITRIYIKCGCLLAKFSYKDCNV